MLARCAESKVAEHLTGSVCHSRLWHRYSVLEKIPASQEASGRPTGKPQYARDRQVPSCLIRSILSCGRWCRRPSLDTNSPVFGHYWSSRDEHWSTSEGSDCTSGMFFSRSRLALTLCFCWSLGTRYCERLRLTLIRYYNLI